MTMNDLLSDLLTRVRNAQVVKLREVSVLYSKLNSAVMALLLEEGYILGYEEVTVRKGIMIINVSLKYFCGYPAISKIVRVSKPGCRVYVKASRIPRFYNGLGVNVLSTSGGLLTDHKARKMCVGGEFLFSVF